MAKKCPGCNGTGQVPDPDNGWKRKPCGRCGGTGAI